MTDARFWTESRQRWPGAFHPSAPPTKANLILSPSVFPPASHCLVKKYLTQTLFKSLAQKRTDSGFTLDRAIASGRENSDSDIGIYAGDVQSYATFSPLFHPIISDYHGVSEIIPQPSDLHPLTLPALDPDGTYIKSTRIRVARNLSGFEFPCHISLSRRQELEKKIIAGLDTLKGELKGTYFSFEHMDENEFQRLKRQKLIFEKGDRFQEAAGINSDFPKGRGVFHSTDRHFIVWVNEEDHLRIISMEKTSSLSHVFNRLCRALPVLDAALDFARDERYGYLTSCPTNIGTSMRAGVHIRLEKLGQKKERLLDLTRSFNLQIRGTGGEKTAVESAVFDISNRQRLGVSEAGIILNLHAGLLAILKAEKGL